MRIELYDQMFDEKERPLCQFDAFSITTFRYESGVAALRIINARGEIIVLPFQGQQIWRVNFDGRDLTMRSMFDEPVFTRNYLENYGAFMIHCGITGLGAPGSNDNHQLHGELPNAPFNSAWLEFDPDKRSTKVGGTYQHIVAFSTNYLATVETAMKAESALLDVSVSVENLKQTPMDLMYLGHANFRPVDEGELHYSAFYNSKSVRVRQSIPSHVNPKPGYKEFLSRLADSPEIHHILQPGLAFDPEVVFEIDMINDADGFAHALQKHPNGTADYVRCRPDQAPTIFGSPTRFLATARARPSASRANASSPTSTSTSCSRSRISTPPRRRRRRVRSVIGTAPLRASSKTPCRRRVV